MIRYSIVLALMLSLPHVARAEDARLPNCNEAAALPCFEMVWVDGAQRKMDFFDLDVTTDPPTQNFYVVAPQTGTPQGIAPFPHDHVVGDDDGAFWHGFFALCSEQALSSGDCVTSAAQGELPLAKTVRGRRLTTTERIESAAGAGFIVLVDTGAVLRARIDGCGGHHHGGPDRR